MSDVNWPEGWDRTPPMKRRGYPHGFEVSEHRALKGIQSELERLGATDVRIDTAKPQRKKDNLPYARAASPEDPGVAVYWTLPETGEQYAIACDQWSSIRDNAQAIAKTLEAKRGIDRWGATTAEREYEGYRALPDDVHGSAGEHTATAMPPDPMRQPHEVLGVSEDAPPEIVQAAFREIAKNTHPDRAPDGDGDPERFDRARKARDKMLQEASA